VARTIDPEERAAAFVAAARSYAGWALIPLNGKEPRSRRWQTATPEDSELTAGKWSEWGKRHGMGVVLGPSRLAVIEDDLADGHEKLLELFGGELPPVPIVKSGGKSLHLYFLDDGLQPAARGGLELRCGRQQVVLPPSVHPDTGRQYEWITGHDLDAPGVALVTVPETARAYFAAGERKKRAAPVGDEIREKDPGRHRTLLSLAGSMRHRGMSGDEIAVALLAVNARRCKPPLPEHEVAELAHDVAARYRPEPLDPEQEKLEREAERLLAGEPIEQLKSASRRRQTAPLIVSLVEFLGGSEDDAAWLVDHLAARGALVVVAGLPKVGKSTFVYGLLGALTGSVDRFVGLPAGSTAALLMTEEPPATVEEKVDRFGVDDERVFVISKRRMGVGRSWAKTITSVVEFCRTRPEVGIVVCDTLDKFADLSPTRSESDTGVVREMIDPLYPLLDLGVCVILITHQRKAEGEYGLRVRGGTALTGSVDVIVEVERPSQSAGLSGASRVVKIVSRFAGAPDEIAVELGADGWRSLGTVDAAARRSKREEILALLDDEPVTLEDVHERAGDVSKDTVRRRLRELVEHGLAERVGEGKRSDPHRWKLSLNGRVFLGSPDSGPSDAAARNPTVQAENSPSDFFASSSPPKGKAACKETFSEERE
jgi:DNA-binding transcriptional ArsR family regulator